MLSEIPAQALRNLFGSNISTTQVLQTVASGMADCGVTVVIDPSVTIPQADPLKKTIYLPAQVKSERALLVVSWFLDHEAAHIIYTPDLRPTLKRWQKSGPMFDVCKAEGFKGIPDSLLGAAKGLLNMVEDSRIEHLLAQRLPGTKKHFLKGPTAAGIDNIIEDIFEEAKKIQAEKGMPEPPLSPFWVAEMHAYCLLDGWHGQQERDYLRKLLPASVGWVLDIIEDEFGDIRDVTKVSYDDLVVRTEAAMAKIIERVLQDAEESDGDGEGEGEGGTDSPYQNKFKKNKNPSPSGQSDDEENESDSEESEEGSSKKGKSKTKKNSKKKSSSSEEEGDSDESDESDSEGDEAGDSEASDSEGEESDPEEGDEEGEGAEDGSEESEEEEEGETGDGNGNSGADSDSSDSDEECEGESDGTGEGEAEDGEEGEEEDGEGTKEPEESHLEDSPVEGRQLPKQVEEWAKEAQVDMADLIRAGGGEDSDGDGDHGSLNGQRPARGASPSVPHETSSDGMPDKYYDNLAPGLRSIVIEGVDLNSLVINQDEVFAVYDEFVQSLMPPNLGPAARKLVGKFKAAPGQAWAGNRVNPRMLQPIMAGKADGRPLFMRRNETVYSKKGVAVMLFLDCSGSMCDTMSGLKIPEPSKKSSSKYYYRDFCSKFAISHATIRSLARVFQASGIPFAVGGFTGTDSKHGRWTRNHSRVYDLVNFMFKDFHEPWAHSEQKMIAMNPFTSVNYKGDHICSHTNCDGESLLWAATRLLAREEDIKVLIVASDGLPAGGDGSMQVGFLKYVVKRLEKANIYVGAIGIGNEGVKHYYRIHELIDHFPAGQGGPDTAPLYMQEKVIRLVDRLMVEGGNRNG